MEEPFYYINRKTGNKEEEITYCPRIMKFFYTSFLGKLLIGIGTKWSFFSKLYGYIQNLAWSKRKIVPFVKKYKIQINDFEKSLDDYDSFNDFFIRRLKKGIRQLPKDPKICLAPADGRYMVFPDINSSIEFCVKGKKQSLRNFLKSTFIEEKYDKGSMVFIRLSPTDYHRFHFPFDCVPEETFHLQGCLKSVHPRAVKDYFLCLGENKKNCTFLNSNEFGSVLFVEIGAINVGTINQTFCSNKPYKKGDEKGFFSLGGSSIAIFFEKDRIVFDEDLLNNSRLGLETLCYFGESLGLSVLSRK